MYKFRSSPNCKWFELNSDYYFQCFSHVSPILRCFCPFKLLLREFGDSFAAIVFLFHLLNHNVGRKTNMRHKCTRLFPFSANSCIRSVSAYLQLNCICLSGEKTNGENCKQQKSKSASRNICSSVVKHLKPNECALDQIIGCLLWYY